MTAKVLVQLRQENLIGWWVFCNGGLVQIETVDPWNEKGYVATGRDENGDLFHIEENERVTLAHTGSVAGGERWVK